MLQPAPICLPPRPWRVVSPEPPPPPPPLSPEILEGLSRPHRRFVELIHRLQPGPDEFVTMSYDDLAALVGRCSRQVGCYVEALRDARLEVIPYERCKRFKT